jgi:hypothetical protein
MEILFRECEGGHDYNGVCEYVKTSCLANIVLLC